LTKSYIHNLGFPLYIKINCLAPLTLQTDVMLVSCDVITDVSLHLLADLHRTYDATVTMLLSPAIDITDVSVPGGKANRKMG